GAWPARGASRPSPGRPYALANDAAREPRGLERITRHPFLVGVALTAGAHALLAPHLIGTVFSAGLLALALGGAWHQDRKLLARRGHPFAAFLAATPLVPFAAIVSGRQRLPPRPPPLGSPAAAPPAVVVLAWAPPSTFPDRRPRGLRA